MKRERLERVIAAMTAQHLDQLLITSTDAIFYLLGTWIEPGERLLALRLTQQGEATLLVNALFPQTPQAGLTLSTYRDGEDAVALLAALLPEQGRLGVDKNWAAHFVLRLQELRPNLTYVNGSSGIDAVRACKDEAERVVLREASRMNDAVMAELIARLRPGVSEREMARLLPELYEAHGAAGISFAPIIAFGEHCALPHHEPDNRVLKAGDSIILDIGGITDHYCSDMTRSLFCGTPDDEYRQIHALVLAANRAAIAAVKPGVTFAAVDQAARSVIEAAGYGAFFTHRTGHGIGILVHEYPDVSAVNAKIVEPGMTFSIEPGIYLPGRYGVRIEDLVIATEDGCEILNQYSKELTCIA